MGHGIAQVFAVAGHPVTIYDPSAAVLEKVVGRIAANLELLGEDMAAAQRMAPRATIKDAVKGASFIVEAAPEDLAIKQAIFAEIEADAAPDATLASNTSVIPITAIMGKLKRRERAVIILLLRSRHGLALAAIRDNETAARTSGVDVNKLKLSIYNGVAFGTALVGALIFLQKLRISPETAFSVNDWAAFIIFIVTIGGIGRVEGPIIGTIVFFLLREFLADLGTTYLIVLGIMAIAVMIFAPQGLWGFVANRFGWQAFPLARRLTMKS
jgi:branched-subunit amino acid ABC-type transport system permease component